MVDVDWEKLENDCVVYTKATKMNSFGVGNAVSIQESKRIKKIVAYVKSIADKYPNLSKDEFKAKVRSSMYGSLSIFWLYVISIVVRELVDYLIERLYPQVVK